MKVCAQCGAPATALKRVRLPEYEETILGLPVVLTNAVDRVTCDTCHASADIVTNQEGLIAAVSLCRVLMPFKFNGTEIRLLRQALNLKSNELAKKLSVSPETMSRWEAGEVMGAQTEKMFRMIAALALMPSARAITVDLEGLMAMQPSPVRPAKWEPVFFELVRIKIDHTKEDGWDTVEPIAA